MDHFACSRSGIWAQLAQGIFREDCDFLKCTVNGPNITNLISLDPTPSTLVGLNLNTWGHLKEELHKPKAEIGQVLQREIPEMVSIIRQSILTTMRNYKILRIRAEEL